MRLRSRPSHSGSRFVISHFAALLVSPGPLFRRVRSAGTFRNATYPRGQSGPPWLRPTHYRLFPHFDFLYIAVTLMRHRRAPSRDEFAGISPSRPVKPASSCRLVLHQRNLPIARSVFDESHNPLFRIFGPDIHFFSAAQGVW